jgi:hypothetical protein
MGQRISEGLSLSELLALTRSSIDSTDATLTRSYQRIAISRRLIEDSDHIAHASATQNWIVGGLPTPDDPPVSVCQLGVQDL